jgi:hypothetical protein
MASPFTEQFLPASVTVPAILTMDGKAKEEWSGNNKMDVDELEGTLAVGKRKAVKVANKPAPKRPKVQGEKILAVDKVVDDLLGDVRCWGDHQVVPHMVGSKCPAWKHCEFLPWVGFCC